MLTTLTSEPRLSSLFSTTPESFSSYRLREILLVVCVGWTGETHDEIRVVAILPGSIGAGNGDRVGAAETRVNITGV